MNQPRQPHHPGRARSSVEAGASAVVVLTTCADVGAAERLAGALVEERLAACVSIGAEAVSVYPWQGRIEREREVPLTIKTTTEALPRLKVRLAELHDYDVPELLVLGVVDGTADSLAWIRDWVDAEPNG